VGPSGNGPEERYSIQLRWNPPELDAEGARLEDLAGFRLYYAPYPQPVLQGGTVIEIGLDAEARVTNLSAGTWSFGVTALDTAGNESIPSELIQVEVGP
jgi:hypothetical protein